MPTYCTLKVEVGGFCLFKVVGLIMSQMDSLQINVQATLERQSKQ